MTVPVSYTHLIAEESYRILVDAIEKLPPQMKSIMQLALEGKSNPEIAETLNISGETVPVSYTHL